MKQSALEFGHEIIVNLFAGASGVSVAIRKALGRSPDVAVNHDQDAIDMHTVNHPETVHYREDVYAVEPIEATSGRPVGLLHASPDCTDHSQAKGGQPRRVEIRSLSWVVLKWAARAKPRCITLENVEQIIKWSPLVAKRDKATGRVVKIDRTVAAPGERVPVQQQFLVPCRRRTGKHWRKFVDELRRMGYVVQWRKLRACDYGAGTSRERLFLMARRDGLPIRWPKPTHGRKRGLKPYVSAADCIDWSIPCRSIFDRPKPLAEATLRRIAKGMRRYVLDCADPFIVPVTHTAGDRVHGVDEPLRTITTAQRGEFMVCTPSIVSLAHGDSGGRREYPPTEPLGTLHAGGGKYAMMAPTLVKFRYDSDGGRLDAALPTITSGGGSKRPAGAAHAMGIATAFLAQHNNHRGTEPNAGKDLRESVPTITSKGSQGLIAASLATLRGDNIGSSAHDPLRTLSAGGEHHAVVEYQLSPEAEAGALRVAAFLIRYYGLGGQWGDCRDPVGTISTKDRIALVTVTLKDTPYVIVDIGLRMFTPPELFKAQGFPASYKITHRPDGRAFTKTALVKLVGNSVSPPPYEALLRANFKHEQRFEEAVA